MKKDLVISTIAAIAAQNPEGYTINAATLQPITSGYAVALHPSSIAILPLLIPQRSARRQAADRKRKQDEEIQEKQRIAREINERRKELAAMPKGFFTVCLHATVNFSYKYYEYEGYSENGEEAYKMAVAKLKKDFGAHLWDYDSILDAEIIPRLLGSDIYSL
jgi:hypothetical protein